MGMTVNASPVWRFGVFEIEAYSGELRRNGVPVRLREQSTRILLFLLEHAGRMVTREQLRQHLWPANTFVDFDHSLNTAVMKLREALGDPADKPIYIQTIPKKGYRFIAPVIRVAEHQVEHALLTSPAEAAPVSVEILQTGEAAIELEPAGLDRPERRWTLLSRKSLMLLLLVVASVGAGTWIRPHAPSIRHSMHWSVVSSNQRLVPLTTVSGNATSPAFSPDARQIAFLWDGEDRRREDVYVQMVGADTPLRLTHNQSGFLSNPQWSPDGQHVAFARCDGKQDGIYLVPALGGQERKLTTVSCRWGAGRPIWTLDGASMLLMDRCNPSGRHGLVLLSLTTGDKRCLTAPANADDFTEALSPDGTTVAFARLTSAPVSEIYTIRLAGGAPRRLTFDGRAVRDLMWTPDGRYITFLSDRGILARTWRVPAHGGPVEPETVYPGVGSISKDGTRFAYADAGGEAPAIWRADLAGRGDRVEKKSKLIFSQYRDDEAQPAPDGGRIAWQSTRTGNDEIWLSGADGTSPVQLTSFGRFSGSPHWSPDGRWIAFDSRPREHSEIYVVDAEGRNLHAITNGANDDVVPSWSRDGKSIYFASMRTGSSQLWKHSLDSGVERQLTQHGGFSALESSDGATLYYTKFDQPGTWSMPAAGGDESLVVAGKPQVGYWGHLAVADAGLYLLDADAEPRPAIDFYSFATHRVTTVLPLEKTPGVWGPSLSAAADGRSIFYTQSDQQSGILMIENLR
ncbi:MAG: winged helix-turn-helix domain-containing protein [Acidobacteriaceae bacterium]